MSINIIGNYIILDKISSGSFGNVYKCKKKDYNYLNKEYAIKISTNLKHETTIYKLLLGCNYISNIIDFFKFNKYECLVLNFYEFNLKQFKSLFFNNNNYIEKINFIITNIIKGLQFIHDKGIIHRDIKPDNICLDENYIPYFIDFGMSKQYIINKKHIDNCKINSIIGSINYASINSINNLQLSRRDDMESLFYVFLFIYLNDELFNMYISNNIEQQKNLNTIFTFLNNKNYKICINYIRNMKFTQKPNYDYINKLMII